MRMQTAGLDKEKAFALAMEWKRHGLNSRVVELVAHASSRSKACRFA
jgi:hypothetical protein